jgi:hypothetical protein
MDVGIFPVGTGASAKPGALTDLAMMADAGGVSTLWSAGHPFRVNALERPYPYAASGWCLYRPQDSAVRRLLFTGKPLACPEYLRRTR